MAEPTGISPVPITPESVVSYATDHLVIASVGAALALTVAILAIRAIRRTVRRVLTGRQPEDILTIVVASIATGVVGTGMWKFTDRVLGFPIWLRVLLFGFIEMATITSAVRARWTMREEARKAAEDPAYEPRGAGPDGIAVWVLTSASAVLSTIDADSFAEGVFRLIAPLISAWLWERGMSVERQRITGRAGINWRITPERLFVWLGIAESTARTAGDVDAHRRLHRVARAAKRLRVLKQVDAAAWRQARALRRLDAAMARAVEHADLATDSDRQADLLARLGALYGTPQLADVTPPAPWVVASPPRLRLYRSTSTSERSADHNLPFETPDDDLSRWFDDGVPHDGDRVPGDEEPVPAVPGRAREHELKAAEVFADEVQRGKVPGIRAIKKRVGVGQPKAEEARAYLKSLAAL